ncbi:MAG: hypothetical protein PHO16_03960 [Candidatus Cloacimonetes bacterium]|nr:hypothetical protein [Candidatus Cloacimonadota bacterium]
MNTRFYLIIALLIILYGAWAFLAHTHGMSAFTRYEALAELPVYAYVADTSMVAPILSEIDPLPGIANVQHETGFQAAQELIESYSIPLSESSIADYQFPDLITISFIPGASNPEAKARLMDILRKYIDETDIDSQSNAFSKILQELDWIQQRSIIFNIYAAIMMLIIFIFIRLSYELHIYLKNKQKMVSVVDVMRHNRLNASHTWIMLLLPVSLVAISYYGGWYLGWWQALVAWWVFVVMAFTAIIASLVIVMMLRVYEHDRILNQSPSGSSVSDEVENV